MERHDGPLHLVEHAAPRKRLPSGADGRCHVPELDGPDRSQAVYFFDAGEPTGQSIYWDDPSHRFWLSADTTIDGSLTMN